MSPPRTKPRGLKKREPKDYLFEDRRDVGMGVVGRWFQYSYKTADEVDPLTQRKVEDVDMHRSVTYQECYCIAN